MANHNQPLSIAIPIHYTKYVTPYIPKQKSNLTHVQSTHDNVIIMPPPSIAIPIHYTKYVTPYIPKQKSTLNQTIMRSPSVITPPKQEFLHNQIPIPTYYTHYIPPLRYIPQHLRYIPPVRHFRVA